MNKREAVKKFNAEFEAWGYTVTVRSKSEWGEYAFTVRKRNAVTGLVNIVDRHFETTHQDALDTARAIIERDRRLSFVIVYGKIDAIFKPHQLRLHVSPSTGYVEFVSQRTGRHALNLTTRTPEEILAHAEGFVAAQATYRREPLKLSGGFDQSKAGVDGREPLDEPRWGGQKYAVRFYIGSIEVKPGQVVENFRGERARFLYISRTPEPGKSGKVCVQYAGYQQENYPSVFNGEIR